MWGSHKDDLNMASQFLRRPQPGNGGRRLVVFHESGHFRLCSFQVVILLHRHFRDVCGCNAVLSTIRVAERHRPLSSGVARPVAPVHIQPRHLNEGGAQAL